MYMYGAHYFTERTGPDRTKFTHYSPERTGRLSITWGTQLLSVLTGASLLMLFGYVIVTRIAKTRHISHTMAKNGFYR